MCRADDLLQPIANEAIAGPMCSVASQAAAHPSPPLSCKSTWCGGRVFVTTVGRPPGDQGCLAADNMKSVGHGSLRRLIQTWLVASWIATPPAYLGSRWVRTLQYIAGLGGAAQTVPFCLRRDVERGARRPTRRPRRADQSQIRRLVRETRTRHKHFKTCP